MQGAREYASAIRYVAGNKIDGFDYVCCGYVCKDHFIFRLGKHARGETLSIYLLKEMPPIGTEEATIYYKYFSKENSLTVYDVVSGNMGWTEKYGFVVNSDVIKDTLSAILSNAVLAYDQAVLRAKETEKERKRAEAEAQKNKVKLFENFLMNENSKIITQSKPSVAYVHSSDLGTSTSKKIIRLEINDNGPERESERLLDYFYLVDPDENKIQELQQMIKGRPDNEDFTIDSIEDVFQYINDNFELFKIKTIEILW